MSGTCPAPHQHLHTASRRQPRHHRSSFFTYQPDLPPRADVREPPASHVDQPVVPSERDRTDSPEAGANAVPDLAAVRRPCEAAAPEGACLSRGAGLTT